MSPSRRATLRSPQEYAPSASRRRGDAAAQQAQVSPPAQAAPAASQLAAVQTAADPAATDNAASSSPLGPVDVCEAHTLHVALSVEEAVAELTQALAGAQSRYGHYASGVVRWEVPLPRGATALQWLQSQAGQAALQPSVYFSPRRSPAPDTSGAAAAEAAAAGAGATAGAGAAWLWTGAAGQPLDHRVMTQMQRLLNSSCGRLRAFGGSRFSTAQAPAPEWEAFGSYYFLLPRIEFLEAAGCCLLSCNLAWDAGSATGDGQFASVADALAHAAACLAAVRPPQPPSAPALRVHRQGVSHVPDREGWERIMAPVHSSLAPAEEETGADSLSTHVDPYAARQEYVANGQGGLDDLLAALDGGFQGVGSSNAHTSGGGPSDGLTKVVLARRTDVLFRGELDPLALLAALQERDPRAYQLALQLPGGATFVASTPEQLYMRAGDAVASEAVAGTRARGPAGDVERDFWLAFDLLRAPKDHAEFTLVRDWIQRQLAGVCSAVSVDRPKSVLKQGGLQHLYGRLSGTLKPGAADAELLEALHPTPAVCGRPREAAADVLAQQEAFDRGFYAGPFGWVSAGGAEFAVAIRSALVHPPPPPPAEAFGQQGGAAAGACSLSDRDGAAQPAAEEALRRISLFAGVGIVDGSRPDSEWAELQLKIRQYDTLLAAPPMLAEAPNINALAAWLAVEELCRMGVSTFAVAPGSRSSPLALAVAQHPRAHVTCCIDERSLAFWALGYGRATGVPAAVITSSGTAVANLLPAVVEASQAGVPLLLLTADRPGELRGCGANQTIDQVKIFGDYTRYTVDLAPPTGEAPARVLLTTLDAAVSASLNPATPGPVHVNCQFREPLGPAAAPWPREVLQGLERWETRTAPFTQYVHPTALLTPGALDGMLQTALAELRSARRGLLVVGELQCGQQAAAAARIGAALGWPIVADVLSGLRVGGTKQQGGSSRAMAPPVISHMDHILLLDQEGQWPAIAPDVVLQLGGHLTSKRLCQFLDWAALGAADRPPTQWVYADGGTQRHDPSHLLTHRLATPLPALAAALEAPASAAVSGLMQSATQPGTGRQPSHGAGQLRPAAGQRQYAALLALLDGVAGRQIDASLDSLDGVLTEPAVARVLSRNLPAGDGLYLGNSMPIRDMDMYADVASSPERGFGEATPELLPPLPAHGFGVIPGAGSPTPVGANRGASGIDGVLSSAAGFAEGLGRGTTLVIGDVSFLHDINGLNLLRTSGARPPLTVVLVNNGGGGIFSFLPAAEQIPEDAFTELWATPQHVDLMGMCRAHGIAHQAVRSVDELPRALESAWRLNRHSVVEVFTSRTDNVGHHRTIQAAVRTAVSRALQLATLLDGPQALGSADVHRLQSAMPSSSSTANAASDSGVSGHSGNGSGPASSSGTSGNGSSPPRPSSSTGQTSVVAAQPPYAVRLQALSLSRFQLPLAAAVTTGAGGASRSGLLLEVQWRAASGRNGTAYGEISPLPGLHKESLDAAQAQAAALCAVLQGANMPISAGLLQGRMEEWLLDGVGIAAAGLLPSVRCGLEAALLSALAAAAGGTFLAALLEQSVARPVAAAASQSAGFGASRMSAGLAGTDGVPAVDRIAVCGLVDSCKTPEATAAAAAALVQQGYTTLKLKVGRHPDPLADAEAVLAVRKAVGPAVHLRCDANRAWDLAAAAAFGAAVVPAGLQFLEEPVAEPAADLAAFHAATGVPTAVDESVDAGLIGPDEASGALLHGTGLAAVVVKPAVVGGFEAAMRIVRWAHARCTQVVISSSFESAVGLSQLAQLAAAVDASWAAAMASHAVSEPPLAHGLGTGHWMAADLTAAPLVSAPKAAGAAISVQAAQRVMAALDTAAARASGLLGPISAFWQLTSHVIVVTTAAGRYSFGWTRTALTGTAEQGGQQGQAAVAAAASAAATDMGTAPQPPAPSAASGYGSTPAAAGGDSRSAQRQLVVLLHGFLGAPGDWAAIAQALVAGGATCVAVGLPGCSNTVVSPSGADGVDAFSLEAMADAIAELVRGIAADIQYSDVSLVGYSLGGRLALAVAARNPAIASRIAVVSGSPGLTGTAERAARAARDSRLASALLQGGLPAFVESWYRGPLWRQLRAHPSFERVVQHRSTAGDAAALATVLAAASPGRQAPLWDALPRLQARLLFVAGGEDAKFSALACRMAAAVNDGSGGDDAARATAAMLASGSPAANGSHKTAAAQTAPGKATAAEVPGCGHTVHLERPEALALLLQEFLQQ